MMSMRTAKQYLQKNGTAVIALGGQVGSANCQDLLTECKDLERRLQHGDVREIVVDCAAATGLGGTALGLLLHLWKSTRRCDGRFSMCGLSAEDLEVLRVVKLDGLWPIYSSRDEALGAVKRRAAAVREVRA